MGYIAVEHIVEMLHVLSKLTCSECLVLESDKHWYQFLIIFFIPMLHTRVDRMAVHCDSYQAAKLEKKSNGKY